MIYFEGKLAGVISAVHVDQAQHLRIVQAHLIPHTDRYLTRHKEPINGHLESRNFCTYNNQMKITFDLLKNRSNFSKHGVELSLASSFEWETAVTWEDLRESYGETRLIAIGYIGLRLHVIVYVDRTDNRRIISLRKANRREVMKYAET